MSISLGADTDYEGDVNECHGYDNHYRIRKIYKVPGFAINIIYLKCSVKWVSEGGSEILYE